MATLTTTRRRCLYCGEPLQRRQHDYKWDSKKYCSVDHANKAKGQQKTSGWRQRMERQRQQASSRSADSAISTACLQAASTCVHHWLVEPPNGRYSQGVCRHCQAVRAFDNSWGGDDGGDDPKATFRDTLPAVLGRTGLHLVEE